jgi:hypothetical protein
MEWHPRKPKSKEELLAMAHEWQVWADSHPEGIGKVYFQGLANKYLLLAAEWDL